MTIASLLLTRAGLVQCPAGQGSSSEQLVQAAELELANLGYVLSPRLRARLATLSPGALGERVRSLAEALSAQLGANQKHAPLFRRFPDGVPRDTTALWWQKVLSAYLQQPDQPCLFCLRSGGTHVLRPCRHVVCDHCFDGSNYSACPVCERPVEPGSPFFRPDEVDRRLRSTETVRFKRLDLTEDLDDAARDLFQSLCARPQVLNPDDLAALVTLVEERAERLPAWLPERIPARENVAHIFGRLLKRDPGGLDLARPYLKTATDLLRLVAVLSGGAPALQTTTREVRVKTAELRRWQGARRVAVETLQAMGRRARSKLTAATVSSAVFEPARLSRAMRRAFLAFLDQLPRDTLVEDMLRHAAVWVRVGERLHPFEQADRFPNAALAFAVVRGSRVAKLREAGFPLPPLDDGGPYWTDARGRLRFENFYGRVERLLRAEDWSGTAGLLSGRPGELGRRLDLLLRREASQGGRAGLDALAAQAPSLTVPMLLTLSATLAVRERPLPVRVFFPKGEAFLAPSAPDTRPTLPATVTAEAREILEAELLRRLSALPPLEAAVLDQALDRVIVPMNERTASPAAVNLTRGSVIPAPRGEWLRLFLHWCQPDRAGTTTDIDLSVGFYDSEWNHVGVCSYYQLLLMRGEHTIARSSGDLRAAPFPDGASEFIDLHRASALNAGFRYAVMVVTNYAGLSFTELERGFAGLMARDDAEGAVFDPRKVVLRFNLSGDNGVYAPLVLDLEKQALFWLDAFHKGEIELNNVANANKALTRICPETMAYFGSGTRPSMLRLAAAHAAARCPSVTVREDGLALQYRRQVGETALQLYRRILAQEPDGIEETPPSLSGPVFAALLHGDLELPAGSTVYALFREGVVSPLAASDLLSGADPAPPGRRDSLGP